MRLMTWDETDVHDGPPAKIADERQREVVDVDTLDDGRCTVSSWRGAKPAKPTYENHFGPGGYNRCVGSVDHANPTHKDEWGNVFTLIDGHFRQIRLEQV